MLLRQAATHLLNGLMLLIIFAGIASAEESGDPAFTRIWERTDRPVAKYGVQRTWMWGPEAITPTILEEYADSPGDARLVQYFDKSRMEITDPEGDRDSPWYVTNGLLVVELATGRLQLGDTSFEQREPVRIAVAGDPDSPGPTYATFGQLMDEPAYENGEVITKVLAPDGTVSDDPSFAGLDVTAYYYVPETRHQVAEPFWYFLTSDQPVYENGQVVSGKLFPHPFYATGLPITEAYWVHTKVGGYETSVLVQAFERRVLTYTPTNQAGWQVESGNVGRHYYEWRYGTSPDIPGNVVVTSFDTGPDTIEYYAKGNPRPGELDWGPTALSVAPDGSYWIADGPAHRLAHFNLAGERIGTIDLADQHARSIWDIDARTGIIWVSWANLDLGIYKLQGYDQGGWLLYDFDLPEAIWKDSSYLSHGIEVVDGGAVAMVFDLGMRFVRVVDGDGMLNPLPLEHLTYNGRSYRFEADEGVLNRIAIVVDQHEIPIQADEGAFALQVDLISTPDEDSFYITRYSVFGDGSYHWNVEHRALDGSLLGVTTVPEDERYAFVPFDFSVGPDGHVYKLVTYRDHIEILRLGFVQP